MSEIRFGPEQKHPPETFLWFSFCSHNATFIYYKYIFFIGFIQYFNQNKHFKCIQVAAVPLQMWQNFVNIPPMLKKHNFDISIKGEIKLKSHVNKFVHTIRHYKTCWVIMLQPLPVVSLLFLAVVTSCWFFSCLNKFSFVIPICTILRLKEVQFVIILSYVRFVTKQFVFSFLLLSVALQPVYVKKYKRFSLNVRIHIFFAINYQE